MAGRPRSRPREDKVLLTAQVPVAMSDALSACALAEGVSVSALIRRGIKAALAVLEGRSE